MTEYIDKTEAMRRFKPFGREIPKEQVMAVLARIDEGIVRCGEWTRSWRKGVLTHDRVFCIMEWWERQHSNNHIGTRTQRTA